MPAVIFYTTYVPFVNMLYSILLIVSRKKTKGIAGIPVNINWNLPSFGQQTCSVRVRGLGLAVGYLRRRFGIST